MAPRTCKEVDSLKDVLVEFYRSTEDLLVVA